VKKRGWIIVVAVVVVAGLTYVGIRVPQRVSAGRAAAQAAGTETAVVRRGSLQVTVGASGSLSPKDEVPLSFQSGGQVAEVLVEVGDVVQAGDALARLDDTSARQAVAEAQLSVQEAQANLNSTRIETEAGLAQANLDAAQASYVESSVMAAHTGDQLTSTRVSLAEAEDQLTTAMDNYYKAWDPARDWELYVPFRKASLENERNTTRDALQSAQYNLQVAQAAYNLAAAGVSDSSVESARAQVVNAQVTVDKEPVQIQLLQITLSQAQLQLESAQHTLAETTLVAPVSGTVTAVNIKANGTTAGETAVVLSDLSTLVVDINLDETDVVSVSIGQEATVTLDAFSNVQITGTVTSIAPVAEVQSGVVLYPVTVRLAPTSVPARAGMTVDVEIVTASGENMLIVPLRAIHSVNGQSFVLRRVQGPSATPSGPQRPGAGGNALQVPAGFELVPVTLGLTNDTDVEITSGLSEGDVVSVAAIPNQNSGPSGGSFRMFGGGGG
jgi:HlyD family secretion protein